MLSTHHDRQTVDKRPKIIDEYNQFMGGEEQSDGALLRMLLYF